MKTSFSLSAVLIVLCLAGLLIGMLASAHAAETSTELEISVPQYKSDTVRMIEAYERLSDQYLKLVQHQLNNMDITDQRILQKLETLEKKVDALNAKLDAMNPPKIETKQPKPKVLY